MPTVIRRRPQGQQMPANTTPQGKMAHGICVQGFRNAINATGATPLTFALNSKPKRIIGISVLPVSGTIADIADTQLTFVVNNLNLLLLIAAQNLCPNYIQGFLYYPLDVDVKGNDSITANVQKNSGAAITMITNIFYIA